MSGSRDNAMKTTLVDMLNTSLHKLDADVKKQLKQLATKENKQAYLDEYSQNPWCVPGSSRQAIDSPKTAFDYFLSLGRVTGQLYEFTESSREYADLKTAERMFGDENKRRFLAEEVFALDRAQENPYYARGLKHKAAGHYLRAVLDFEVAQNVFTRHHQVVEVSDCQRESILCLYKANWNFRAYIKLTGLMQAGVALQPHDKVAGALASIRCSKENPACVLSFNPLSVLCEALAESQSHELAEWVRELLKEAGFISECIEKYCPSDLGLMIDLLLLLPDDICGDVILSFLSKYEASYKNALQLSEEGRVSAQKKMVGFYADAECLARIPLSERDKPLWLRHEVYSSSAIAAYEYACSLQEEKTLLAVVQEPVAKSLKINPAFLPARLLSLELNGQFLNHELAHLFRDIFKKHPGAVKARVLAYDKLENSVAKNNKDGKLKPGEDSALIYEFAEALVASYDSDPQQASWPEGALALYHAAKVDLVVHAIHRRDRIKRFLACDPQNAHYPIACGVIKKTFPNRDRILMESVDDLLRGSGQDCIQGLRLLAASDKRTSAKHLLFKASPYDASRSSIVDTLKGQGTIGGYNQTAVMRLFTPKLQTFLKDRSGYTAIERRMRQANNQGVTEETSTKLKK